jgi:hypothetical protein
MNMRAELTHDAIDCILYEQTIRDLSVANRRILELLAEIDERASELKQLRALVARQRDEAAK